MNVTLIPAKPGWVRLSTIELGRLVPPGFDLVACFLTSQLPKSTLLGSPRIRLRAPFVPVKLDEWPGTIVLRCRNLGSEPRNFVGAIDFPILRNPPS